MGNYYVTLKVDGYVTFELSSEDVLSIGDALNASIDTPLKISSNYADGELSIDDFEFVTLEKCGCR